jgi:protein gp37
MFACPKIFRRIKNLNKTPIEWCDYTHNYMNGCFGCEIEDRCYARIRFAPRQKHRCPRCYEFVPHIHPERWDAPLHYKKPVKIFADSMGDLFDLEPHYIKEILAKMEETYWHTFIVLTKKPQKAVRLSFPRNVWLGVSVTDMKGTWRVDWLNKAQVSVRFVSLEPLRSRMLNDGWNANLDWLIIGGMTGRFAVQPEREWVREILGYVKCPVFLKDNLEYPVIRREFPCESPSEPHKESPRGGKL